MALRSKVLSKELEAEEPAQEQFSQRQKPDIGQFRLQVDRQTKASFETFDAAEAVGMVIKKGHPVVQVSIYDAVECVNRVLELPKA
jgi:hypothetical protein